MFVSPTLITLLAVFTSSQVVATNSPKADAQKCYDSMVKGKIFEKCGYGNSTKRTLDSFTTNHTKPQTCEDRVAMTVCINNAACTNCKSEAKSMVGWFHDEISAISKNSSSSCKDAIKKAEDGLCQKNLPNPDSSPMPSNSGSSTKGGSSTGIIIVVIVVLILVVGGIVAYCMFCSGASGKKNEPKTGKPKSNKSGKPTPKSKLAGSHKSEAPGSNAEGKSQVKSTVSGAKSAVKSSVSATKSQAKSSVSGAKSTAKSAAASSANSKAKSVASVPKLASKVSAKASSQMKAKSKA